MPVYVKNDQPQPAPDRTEGQDFLRPYRFHGLRLDNSPDGVQHYDSCLLCGHERKFSVNAINGLWKCWRCSEGGNIYTFIRKLWKLSDRQTNGATDALAGNRRLLYPETLTHWGVVQSALTKEWLVPGYGVDGALNQLYKYVRDEKRKRWNLFPTPGLHHQLHMPTAGFDSKKPDVYICEGPWDGMALWEVMRSAKTSDGHLSLTGNELSSLLSRANVVAVPGCGSVGKPFEKWLPLFEKKRVILMFDNDHPREHNGKTTLAGFEATQRAVNLLSRAEQPPTEVCYLKWGEAGYDKNLPDGLDVRDCLSQGPDMTARISLLESLMAKAQPIPADWVKGGRKGNTKGAVDMACLSCTDWKTLVNVWRSAMHWTGGLDQALSVILACVTSTKVIGDQLWMKVVGPASCGKSTLCEAVSINKKYVLAKSTIRGFHSGFKSDRDGSEDNSLVAQLFDKTLVTKDGDTLLKAPNLEQILAEARDLYDSTSRTHYRNKMGKDYQGVRMTWILCGTSALRQIDQSELGERFLDCVIMDGIDDDQEDEILWRVVNRTDRIMAMEADGQMDTQHDPDLVKAMQLTGGYVSFLRENARDLLSQMEITEENLRLCLRFGKFVSYLRARPSLKQDETAEREFGARLSSQFVRLAKCLGVVLNTKKVNDEVMSRVRKVAFDTARGKTLDIVHILAREGDKGTNVKSMVVWTSQSEVKLHGMLKFLRKIGVVECFKPVKPEVFGHSMLWKLTPKLTKLYNEVKI